MKQIFSFFFLAACVIAFSFSTNAYSQITLQAGGGAGIVAPAGDYGGTTMDFYNGVSYGLSSGWDVHAKARVGLLGLNLTGELSYASISNTGNSEPGKGTIDVKQTITSIKAGPEFGLGFIPMMKPYVGANLALNIFNGTSTFQGVEKVPSGTVEMKSTSRIGIGVNAGMVLGVAGISLDLGLAYNVMNLSGRLWEDVDPGKDERIDSYRALNDDKDPLYQPGNDKHFIANPRAIHTIGIGATILFGL